jgi:mycothiol synthase
MGSASPPDGYTVRAATWDDLAAVAKLVRVIDVADFGVPDLTPGMLRDMWSNPALDLAADVWIVMPAGGGEPVAYGWILGQDRHRKIEGWGVVHPDHRGLGLEEFNLDRFEARADDHAALAPPDGPVVVHNEVTEPDRLGHELLERRGYRLVRHFWEMEAPLGDDLRPPHEVPGIAIRTFVKGADDRSVYEAHQESFSEHWGWVRRPFEEWAQHRLEGAAFDPGLWFLAVDGDEVAGVLMGMVFDGKPWVGTLGVRKPWRGRGIGEALLRRSFLEFRRRGHDHVALGVDAANETGANALYERVGMHVTHQFDEYEKRLR